MVASLPLEGVETNMLLLLESGRSHPEIGTKGVQSYLYAEFILYTVYRIRRTEYSVQDIYMVQDTVKTFSRSCHFFRTGTRGPRHLRGVQTTAVVHQG